MEPGEWLSTSPNLMQWLSVLAMTIFASGVALTLNRRTDNPALVSGWLRVICGAVVVGSVVWCVHFIGAFSPLSPITDGYRGGLAFAAWCIVVCAAIPAQKAALESTAGRGRQLLASIVLGAGVFACEYLSFTYMRSVPDTAQTPMWAVAVIASVALGNALALEVHRFGAPGAAGSALRAGAVLTAGLSLGVHNLSGLTGQPLALLALVGTGGFIASLSAFAAVENRIREALSTATTLVEQSTQIDALTALPNRAAFERKLKRAAYSAEKRQRAIALLYISLDNFKSINDTFGNKRGDALLQAVARRLEGLAPDHYLARLGGDEFAVLLAVRPGEAAAQSLGARAIAVLQAGFLIDDQHMTPRCSVGIVEFPLHGEAAAMLARGEAAVRAARRQSATVPVTFEPPMLDELREQLELLSDLRVALSLDQFKLHYQPKIHAPSGAITGAEALLRWNHPKRGVVAPGVFIPIAERHELIGELGNWVIDEACRQARAWRDEGLRMRVSINLSVSQLREPDLAERIGRALKKHQVNASLLTCELTESLAMEDSDTTIAFFAAVSELGVRVSIDDFGTGYSSLSYLRKLPAEELKIDRSFILDLAADKDARAVVDAVIKLARALGLQVVAEGVETERQSEILRDLGCDQLQGYLFAKPMTGKALALWALQKKGPKDLKFSESLFRGTSITSDVPTGPGR